MPVRHIGINMVIGTVRYEPVPAQFMYDKGIISRNLPPHCPSAADHVVWVPIEYYGIVEDTHHSGAGAGQKAVNI